MWSREQFHSHLVQQLGAEAGATAAAGIEEQINEIVSCTLRSVCDVVEPRTAAFELYGLDLMVDRAHRVWLLEANSSPDMSRSAAPLRRIVDEGLDDLVDVVLDLQQKRVPVAKLSAEREKRAGPCWRLAYKGRAIEETELMRRRFRKKCGVDALTVTRALAAGTGGPPPAGAARGGEVSSRKGTGLGAKVLWN